MPAPRRYSCRCLNPLPSSALVESGGISQVPGQPLREHALLFDPGGPDASGPYDAPDVAFPSLDWSAPRLVTFRGSITQPVHSLSTLRSSDYSDRHHARLASRWRPTLAGQDLNLLGCIRRFLSAMSLHITSILLRQALPGAPNAVTAARAGGDPIATPVQVRRITFFRRSFGFTVLQARFK